MDLVSQNLKEIEFMKKDIKQRDKKETQIEEMLTNMANYFDIPINRSKNSSRGQRSLKLIEKLMKALIPDNQEQA